MAQGHQPVIDLVGSMCCCVTPSGGVESGKGKKSVPPGRGSLRTSNQLERWNKNSMRANCGDAVSQRTVAVEIG